MKTATIADPLRLTRIKKETNGYKPKHPTTTLMFQLDPIRVEIRKTLPLLILACAVITDRQARPEMKDFDLDRRNYLSEQFLRTSKWRGLTPIACRKLRDLRKTHERSLDPSHRAMVDQTKADYTAKDSAALRAEAIFRCATVALVEMFNFDNKDTPADDPNRFKAAIQSSPALLEAISRCDLTEETVIEIEDRFGIHEDVVYILQNLAEGFVPIHSSTAIHLRATKTKQSTYERSTQYRRTETVLPLTSILPCDEDMLIPGYNRTESGRNKLGSLNGRKAIWSVKIEEQMTTPVRNIPGDSYYQQTAMKLKSSDLSQALLKPETALGLMLAPADMTSTSDARYAAAMLSVMTLSRGAKGGSREDAGRVTTAAIKEILGEKPDNAMEVICADIKAHKDTLDRAVRMMTKHPLRDWHPLQRAVSHMLLWAAYGVIDSPDTAALPEDLLRQHAKQPFMRIQAKDNPHADTTEPAWIAESPAQTQDYLAVGDTTRGALGPVTAEHRQTSKKQIDYALDVLQPLVLGAAWEALEGVVRLMRETGGHSWDETWMELTAELLETQVKRPELVACADFLKRVVPDAVALDEQIEASGASRSMEMRVASRYGVPVGSSVEAVNPLSEYCRRELLYMSQQVGQRTDAQSGRGDSRYVPDTGLAQMSAEVTPADVLEAAEHLARLWVNPAGRRALGIKGSRSRG